MRPSRSPDTFRPYLRDGVEAFLNPSDGRLIFVYLATRQRVHLACQPFLHESLEWLSGDETVSTLVRRIPASEDSSRHRDQFVAFLDFLWDKGIVIDAGWLDAAPFEPRYRARLERQLTYLLDLLGDQDAVIRAQAALAETHLAIIGLGATGSWLAAAAASLGMRRFVLVDPKDMDDNAVARHDSHSLNAIGQKKTQAARRRIIEIDPGANVAIVDAFISPNTDLDEILSESTVVANCADEPYVGHLNLILGRYCVARRLPFLAAGGFDAHLGCAGELVIPGRTACSDCYVRYFTAALKDWQPVVHPVADRTRGPGGLASLSGYAGFSGALKILRYVIGLEMPREGRTELLFDDYTNVHTDVRRDPSCRRCSGVATGGESTR